jgi:hypothetical protein
MLRGRSMWTWHPERPFVRRLPVSEQEPQGTGPNACHCQGRLHRGALGQVQHPGGTLPGETLRRASAPLAYIARGQPLLQGMHRLGYIAFRVPDLLAKPERRGLVLLNLSVFAH